MPLKKKGKKGKKKSKKSGKASKTPTDSLTYDHIELPPKPREKLIKLLTTHTVDEKELYGFQVSTKILEKLTPEEIRDLRLVFEAFDVQERECLGPYEVKKALSVLGFKTNRAHTKQAIDEATVQNNGFIDFNDFLDLVINQQGDSRDIYDEIMQGFKMFDYDNVEKISLDNLKQACQDAGVKFSKEELLDMMQEADTNGDGYVDKDEFIKVMLQTNLF